MASNAKQEYYRRIMKEKKSSSVKRIDHPLARYNQLDQLSCIVCSVVVKSDILWQTHLQSKHHKEKINELKSKPTRPTKPHPIKSAKQHANNSKPVNTSHVTPASSMKRPAPNDLNDEQVPKKSKGPLPSEVPSNRVPDGFFDVDNNDSTIVTSESDRHADSAATPNPNPPLSHSNLPADFFDPPSQEAAVDDEEDTQDKTETNDTKKSSLDKKTDSDLPEGFFDDPKIDAKKRNVEFKDPKDTAWEDFQKTISKESEVSEAIVEKGDEHMQDDRELVEVNEQVACFQKAEELRLKQEQLRNKTLIKKEPCIEEQSPVNTVTKVNSDIKEEGSSDNEDLELDELLDWRFKT